MIPWLDRHDDFPPLELALSEPNGLLCAGGDLSPERIVAAYRRGIFPWYSRGEPVLWWSPDPRMALFPEEFRISRSLLQTLRRGGYDLRLDGDFAAVIHACAETPRRHQRGTWITPEMARAYQRLFDLNYAHSVEVRRHGALIGGLYGLSIGRMFYGESMFSHATDASKIALAHLVRFLRQRGFGLIDCQMSTPHLASLGAREIPRREFSARLDELVAVEPSTGRWPTDAAADPWS